MGKCSNCKNEILKGHKFCGNCGVEAKDEQPETMKCGKCQGETLKAHAFCPGCGTAQAGDDERFKSALDLLGAFALERVAFEKTHGALPELDLDEIDLKSVNELLERNTEIEERPDGKKVASLDAGPIIGEMLKSLHALTQQGRADSAHHNAHLKSLGEGMKAVCSAVAAIGQHVDTRLNGMDETIKGVASASRGRRGLTTVTALERGLNKGGGGEGDDDSLEHLDIRAALNAALKSKPELFSVPEVGVVMEITNNGQGLKQIRAYHPGLALKCVQALELIGKKPAAA